MKKINHFPAMLYIAVLLWSALPLRLTAQWSTNPLVNNAISTVLYYDKFVPAIVSDGAGGAIITWEDSRNDGSFFDIYAQRINASGVVLWTADGVPISTGSEDRRAPAIASDGTGGAIITWKDSRTGYGAFDIYAQRINASGAVQWTTDGLAVCTAAGVQESQTIVSDGAGGAIITWVDQRAGGGKTDIYAQRIDANGSIHSGWTAGGVAVTSNSITTVIPAIISDGSGGTIITWADRRDLSNYHIYAQRMDGSGAPLWTANGAAICTYAGNQTQPKIVRDGSTGAIIMWGDDRGKYAQRIDASGAVQWTVNGVAIGPLTAGSLSPISDGSGGAIFSFKDNRSFFSFDIYAQKVNASGVVQWTANGVPICTAANDQQNASIVGDGAGGAIISWQDQRNGSYDIYAQRINTSGDTLWTADGAEISTHAGTKLFPAICSEGANGAIVTWYDYRSGYNSDIYAAQINADGHLGVLPLPVELVSFVASSNQHSVALKWKTATEINNYGFEVERKQISPDPSLHGGNPPEADRGFSRVGFVEGNGTTNSPKSYSFVDAGASGKVAYRLKQTDRDGAFAYSQEITATVASTSAVFALLQNYPNPFNPTTTIDFTVPTGGRATLKIVNALGQEVAILFNDEAEAGMHHHVQFNASTIASGMYFARLESDGQRLVKRMIVLK